MRIVSLVPSATEMLFALGLGERLVAVTHECDHPEAARGLPKVTRDVLPAGLTAAGIDAAVRARVERGEPIYVLEEEALQALAPDLIVTQALCAVCAVSHEDVRAMADRMASPPKVVSLDPRTLREVLDNARTLGGVTGADDAAADLLRDADERIDRVQAAVEGQARPRVAALEWLDPVYVAGHWTPELIELAGGEDVLGRAGGHSEVRSWEDVAAARPEVVIVMPCGYDAARAHEEALEYAERLAALGARQIVALNASAYFSRPGPRLIDGLELLAHVFHPHQVPRAAAAPVAVEVGAP